jgi:hypothetical protein
LLTITASPRRRIGSTADNPGLARRFAWYYELGLSAIACSQQLAVRGIRKTEIAQTPGRLGTPASASAQVVRSPSPGSAEEGQRLGSGGVPQINSSPPESLTLYSSALAPGSRFISKSI